METSTCTVCCKAKTALSCDKCDCASCKHCLYFIDENSFEYPSLLPEAIRDKAFCPNCYNNGIGESLEHCQETLLKAKDVNVFLNDQGAETRLIRRTNKPINIKDCDDREDTLMRLAYLAADQGCDIIVDVHIRSKKLKISGAYKKLIWDGTAMPVDPKQKRNKVRHPDD